MRESNERDARIEVLSKELSEAREQQAATSAILRVIAATRTDIQPVLTPSPKALPGSAMRMTQRSICGVATDWPSAHITGRSRLALPASKNQRPVSSSIECPSTSTI